MGNPLRTAQDRRLPRIPEPCALVIFGVTGDLSRKKLIPAVYDLANRGLLPPGFALVGFARRDWADEDFAEVVHDAVREHSRTPFRQEVWDRLAEGCRFSDCRHQGEPGCEVGEAVARGDLAPERLESFHKLQREQHQLQVKQDELARLREKQKNKAAQKALREHYRLKPRGD